MASVYATPDQVRSALADNSGGSNDNASGAALSNAQLTDAIVNASAQVDGALAVRYALPLAAPVPQLVVSLATDIAAWLASMTWRRNRTLPTGSPVQSRYDRATGLLTSLAAGTIALPVAPDRASGAVTYQVTPDFFWLGNEFNPPPWYGPVEVGGGGPGTIESVAALAQDRVVLAREPDVLFEGGITRSAGGSPLLATVRWPDGSPGTFTGVEDPGHPGKLQSWVLTYGQLPVINTYTQPALTRDGAGNVTNQPAIAAT